MQSKVTTGKYSTVTEKFVDQEVNQKVSLPVKKSTKETISTKRARSEFEKFSTVDMLIRSSMKLKAKKIKVSIRK